MRKRIVRLFSVTSSPAIRSTRARAAPRGEAPAQPAITRSRDIREAFAKHRPRTPDALWSFVRDTFDLRIPRAPIVPGSDAPFDYLVHTYFEGTPPGDASHSPDARNAPRAGAAHSAECSSPRHCVDRDAPGAGLGGDCVVWAARGGGKTMLGAVATMLDLLFKPGIQVRVLAGSLEQSSRMFEHLVTLARKPAVRTMMLGEPTRRRVLLRNGSRAELLATSHASIRGIRIQKLRCDEVELIDEEFWQAAQLTTRSVTLGGRAIRGAVDALSTMHRPAGLMSRLVTRDGVRRLRWTAIDVLETCPPERPCDACELHADCRGRAKQADGFLRIDDLIQMRRRTSDATWDAEMMCRGASVQHRVYPSFDPRRHVDAMGGQGLLGKQEGRNAREIKSSDKQVPGTDPNQANRSVAAFQDSGVPAEDPSELVVGGLDFGLRAPLVMLWARVREAAGGDPRLAAIEVFDEHHAEGLTLDAHLASILATGRAAPAWIGIDPAGEARNTQTGVSDAEVLRRRGLRTRAVRMPVRPGIDAVRRRLDRGTLRIHPRCVHLIAALASYSYPEADPDGETPVHDAASHACDALRYLVTCLEAGAGEVTMRGY